MAEEYVKITVQVTRAQRKAFKLACVKLGKSMSTVIRKAILDTILAARQQQGGGRRGYATRLSTGLSCEGRPSSPRTAQDLSLEC